MHDVSPSTEKVVAFDVMKFDNPDDTEKSSFCITAATANTAGLTTIHHTRLDKSSTLDWKSLFEPL
jgi:hypothetical protein